MNYRMISNIIGKVMAVEAAFMLPALLISLFSGESRAALGLGVSMAVILALAAPFAFRTPEQTDIRAREGLVTAGASWIVVSLLGALPFCISGAIPSYVDCVFETASGFTTTGATILRDIEALPRGLLYWRSFTHWLGGMGVLVFLLILNPLSAKNSGENMHILRAESPGVRVTKLVPRMKRSASILYLIYIILTLLEFILLVLGRMPAFDALTVSFGTAGTGGFTIRNDSMASYSAYCQWVTAVFMFLFSLNFNVYFLLLLRQVRQAAGNEELHVFAAVVLIATAIVTLNTRCCIPDLGERVRASFFQVTSIISTSGFCTANFDAWPQMSRTTLLLLMFIGACTGSTGGGLKVMRISLLAKSALRSVTRAFHPNAVRLVRSEGEIADEETVQTVGSYFAIYFAVICAAMLLISRDGFSMETNFSAALSCISNVGPGFGAVGAVENYAGFSALSKIILSVTMLIGRLELYPILALFHAGLWKK